MQTQRATGGSGEHDQVGGSSATGPAMPSQDRMSLDCPRGDLGSPREIEERPTVLSPHDDPDGIETHLVLGYD